MGTRFRSAAELGELVRSERRRQKLTQVSFAALCGVSPRLLGELEGGRASVSLDRVLRICSRLGIDFIAVRRGEKL